MMKRNRSLRGRARFWRGLAQAPLLAAIKVAAPAGFMLSTAPLMAQEASLAPLAFTDALSRAFDADPGLRAAGAGEEAAQGGLRQARARPNPVLSTEVENFNGPGDLKGFSSAETTFSLSQEIDVAGQRGARVDLARRELHGAELDLVLRGLDLARDVQTAYFDALATQELVVIAREKLTTAEAVNISVARRVAAARDPLMAGARSEAGLADARTTLTRAQADAATARARLASFWGGAEDFTLSKTDFALTLKADHAHDLNPDNNPDLARLSAERDRFAAAASVERSKAWANPTLSFGYRRFEDRDGDGALVAGFSIPIGVFDRNQGAVAQARANEKRAGYDLEAGRLAIAREYAALQRALSAEAASVLSIEQEVIPQAERALALARDGYNQGAFSYLDVMEAQRALSNAREARVNSLRSYHSNEAALDRLTARFAGALPGKETSQ